MGNSLGQKFVGFLNNIGLNLYKLCTTILVLKTPKRESIAAEYCILHFI